VIRVGSLGREDPLEEDPLEEDPLGGMATHSAATVKSLQSCPTLCNPTDYSPPGSPVPGILQDNVNVN